jgi:hypothetical protein
MAQRSGRRSSEEGIPLVGLDKFTRYVSLMRVDTVPMSITKLEQEFLGVSNAFGGEAGELQNIVKKIIRSGTFYEDCDLEEEFILEAGDALHYLISLITLFGYDVPFIMGKNIEKLEARKKAHLAQERVRAEIAPEPGT